MISHGIKTQSNNTKPQTNITKQKYDCEMKVSGSASCMQITILKSKKNKNQRRFSSWIMLKIKNTTKTTFLEQLNRHPVSMEKYNWGTIQNQRIYL